MGSFDCTCAFTRTSISEGDPILLVALKPDVPLSTANIFMGLHQEDVFRFIGIGEYDSYGTIEGFDNEVEGSDWWDHQFMVHRPVAEALLGYKLKKSMKDSHLKDAAITLIKKAYTARIQLEGGLVGAQYFDKAEIELQLTINREALEILELRQQFLEETEEDEDED